MQRSGINTENPLMYVDRQKERIETILDYLKPYLTEVAPKSWNFHTISLYCFLDWAHFRGIIDISKRPECMNLLEVYSKKSIVVSTQIPKV
jgi:glutathione S-transferase